MGPNIQYDWCPYKKEKIEPRDTHTQRKQAMGRDTRRRPSSKAKNDAWDRAFHHSPQKEPTLLTSSFQTSGYQNCETIQFCCLKQPLGGTLLWHP